MSCVVLAPNFDGPDGISNLARIVVRAVGEAGTTLITLNEPRRDGAGRPLARLDCGGSKPRFLAAALAQALHAGPGTTVIVVHLHLAPAALPFAARGASIATVLCGIEAWKPLTRAQALALARTETLLAISQHTADRFRTVQRTMASRPIVVCPPGVPADDVAPATEPSSEPVALIVGRMAAAERYKGHDALLEAWPAVCRAVPGARLRVVGDGDDRVRLEQKAAALGVAGAVQFAGRLSDKDLAVEYARCAAFVMPSTDEGFGLVFLEAMRAGRACLAVRGAAAEIVVDGETGLVLRDQTPGEVARGVAALLGDPGRARTLGLAGRARFEQFYTADAFRSRFLASVPTLACTA